MHHTLKLKNDKKKKHTQLRHMCWNGDEINYVQGQL